MATRLKKFELTLLGVYKLGDEAKRIIDLCNQSDVIVIKGCLIDWGWIIEGDYPLHQKQIDLYRQSMRGL